MITEKATEFWDLPHAVQTAGKVPSCVCGRPDDAALHQPVVLEKASTTTDFITTKGS